MNNIRYAVNIETGLVYSRVGKEVAIPILEYEKLGEGGDFTKPTQYHLEKIPNRDLMYEYWQLKWTKKIPVHLKNLHRAFWGMKPVKGGTTWDTKETA